MARRRGRAAGRDDLDPPRRPVPAAARGAAALLAPLRALGPELDTLAPAPPVALSALHMDPPAPTPNIGDHRLLGDVFGAGMVLDAESAAAVRGHLDRIVSGFEPYDSGRTYTNFVDHPTPTSAAFDEVTYARLRALKRELDPQDVFRVGRRLA